MEEYSTVSRAWNLLHVLETMLGDTANLWAIARIDVTSWWHGSACANSVGSRYHLMLPVETLMLVNCKTTEKQSKKQGGKILWPPPAKPFLFLGMSHCCPYEKTSIKERL
ncbi:hypothetical protein GOODEAATRI_022464 [Goodea atripinnis]|uniref:Uncharacterized protein n=1 Tax=Goodea atripinnis TaxID=208336 RepID=A0ABV0MUF8_9TELE